MIFCSRKVICVVIVTANVDACARAVELQVSLTVQILQDSMKVGGQNNSARKVNAALRQGPVAKSLPQILPYATLFDHTTQKVRKAVERISDSLAPGPGAAGASNDGVVYYLPLPPNCLLRAYGCQNFPLWMKKRSWYPYRYLLTSARLAQWPR